MDSAIIIGVAAYLLYHFFGGQQPAADANRRPPVLGGPTFRDPNSPVGGSTFTPGNYDGGDIVKMPDGSISIRM